MSIKRRTVLKGMLATSVGAATLKMPSVMPRLRHRSSSLLTVRQALAQGGRWSKASSRSSGKELHDGWRGVGFISADTGATSRHQTKTQELVGAKSTSSQAAQALSSSRYRLRAGEDADAESGRCRGPRRRPSPYSCAPPRRGAIAALATTPGDETQSASSPSPTISRSATKQIGGFQQTFEQRRQDRQENLSAGLPDIRRSSRRFLVQRRLPCRLKPALPQAIRAAGLKLPLCTGSTWRRPCCARSATRQLA